jgi:hypothetical protein
MNRKQTQQFIEVSQKELAVMQAYVDGKEIEYRYKNSLHQWELTPNPSWVFSTYEYRVKKEPRVIYVNEYRDANDKLYLGTGVPNEREAVAFVVSSSNYNRTIKFIEVLED